MLEQLLALDLYHLALVFARMSGALIALPGFGANYRITSYNVCYTKLLRTHI